MGKNKLFRFAEMNTFSNVIQPGSRDILNKDNELKGNWAGNIFKNNNAIILELGCGKGEYTVNLAEKFPDKNFIGIDIKGARMWVGAKKSLNLGLTNAVFLRTRIEFINSFFSNGEVDEIWIVFPDPHENKKQNQKRLTSSVFLNKYKGFLKKDGIVNLKTDNEILYNYTLNIIRKNNLKLLHNVSNLYNSEHLDKAHNVKTFYEQMFLEEGKPIHYLQFTLEGNENIEEPEEK